ncbi:MAG TPA: DUF4142 domain-containing protein [Candidatus Limnocylindria bacterium]|jgi:putative membrane protein|nr:DUF4142 domain-containing protein [Candidatus Limnocylindria bacterium]
MKIQRRLRLAAILFSVAIGCIAPTVWADSTAPINTTERTGHAERKLTAQRFVTKASMDGMKEVKLAELANEKAVTPEVKAYAGRLLTDHQQANERLTAIAQKKGYKLPPADDKEKATASNTETPKPGPAAPRRDNSRQTAIDPALPSVDEGQSTAPKAKPADDEDSALAELRNLSGTDFEKAYLKEMVSAHHKAILLFTKASQEVEDEDVKTFASNTLPTLRDHLRDASLLSGKTVAGR